MSRYLYSAALAPFGKPVPIIVQGEGARTVLFDEFGWVPKSSPVNVRIRHDGENIGQAGAIVRHAGWWTADFTLDPDKIDEETEDLIKVGQPLSVGLDVFRSKIDPHSGIEDVRQAVLDHVAIWKVGMIPGAQITGKRAIRSLPPERPPAPPPIHAPLMTREDEAHAAHCAARGMLYRPGIGQVIGVR